MDHDRLCHLLLDGREGHRPDRLSAAVAADRAFERVVRSHDGIALPEMVAEVVAGMDAPLDPTARARAVEEALSWHLPDPSAPVALLPPDTLVHAPSLFARAVFTHRLGAAEQVDGEVHIHTDLAAFQRSHGAFTGAEQLWAEDRDDGGVVWVGPYGWLHAYPLDALLAVRVSADGERFQVGLEVLNADPPESQATVALLREVYDAETARTGLPVTAEDLALGMLLRDNACFAHPRLPLTELAAAAGLERRRHEFGHDAQVWKRSAAVARKIRLTRALGRGDAARHAVRTLTALEDGGREELRGALDLLYDETVLHAVTGELPGDAASLLVLSRRMVAAADRPARSAVAHWFAALGAERDGQVLEAEGHLRSAVLAAPTWPRAQRRLAEYECDRGEPDAATDVVPRLLGRAEAHLRRCREFASDTMEELADLRGCDERLVVDVLLWEAGWFRRFLVDRGPLLPATDAGIAAGWVDVERTAYEVVCDAPDGGVTLHDLRSGERVAVAGVRHPVGARLCARVVPVGEARRFVGEILHIPPGRDSQLQRVLQRRDGRGLLAWVAAAAGPTDQLVDGDPKVQCQVVVRTEADPVAALDVHLLQLGPGWWAWISEDGEVIGSVLGDGNEVTASTSSEAHLDRLLADLAVVLPSFVVVSDERQPVRPWQAGTG
ncbi:MAG: hypothetical protein L0H64_00485 [Pseudonocardia sp.]|nr:hypothetical protein [Pseudonocardia sp.]